MLIRLLSLLVTTIPFIRTLVDRISAGASYVLQLFIASLSLPTKMRIFNKIASVLYEYFSFLPRTFQTRHTIYELLFYCHFIYKDVFPVVVVFLKLDNKICRMFYHTHELV